MKAALVRGRRSLTAEGGDEVKVDEAVRDELERYARLFNAKDWDGLRALIGDDCRLDLVSKSQRRGKQVGMYFVCSIRDFRYVPYIAAEAEFELI